jgi:hypothetical protein
MLLIGIIKEIKQLIHSGRQLQSLAYFLIQGTDSKLNEAVTVLRGFLYLLLNGRMMVPKAAQAANSTRTPSSNVRFTNLWELSKQSAP